MAGVFITGTDTGVGKTYLTTQLLRLLRARGFHCAGFKPICCGDRNDAEQLLAASSEGFGIDDLNPLWLRTPAAPLTAAQVEKITIEPPHLIDAFQKLRERCDVVLVEGVGGWRVPITQNYFVSDLAAALDLPVLVVALNQLGCLNHTLLTVQSIEMQQMTIAGVVLNPQTSGADIASTTNAEILREILGRATLPMLAEETTELSDDWRRGLKIDGL